MTDSRQLAVQIVRQYAYHVPDTGERSMLLDIIETALDARFAAGLEKAAKLADQAYGETHGASTQTAFERMPGVVEALKAVSSAMGHLADSIRALKPGAKEEKA